MTTNKEANPGTRATRESEIFRDPPGSGNYSSSIGAAQGLELFSGSEGLRKWYDKGYESVATQPPQSYDNKALLPRALTIHHRGDTKAPRADLAYFL